ncbi:AGE family epimerase/isomerase [Natrononativus amylolyticus]|uniref:AGE family epimerase/isomerase n=1 Tax=Natrononativus amylolyticus TaxID=2963434 RepID=UPI0020CDBCE9|nr:AGE family epimerase/isomerase [Natrononativus amylolyticus]
MTIYRTERGLRHQFRDVLNFYYPDCIDTAIGGYVAQLDEREGYVYDPRSRHLVATARGIHNFSLGVLADGPGWCRAAAEHGMSFLETAHWDSDEEGYDWLLEGRETVDATRYAYGHAFVLLAGARAHQVGISGGLETLERAADVLESRFWDPEYDRFADQATADWGTVEPYRGQNANMHACEAYLAAYEATGRERFLERALAVADAVVREGASETDGLLWEHFTEEWEPDLEYNREEPADRFRPWGYQPGHHAEWAKLLLLLAEHRSEGWLETRARELFDAAVTRGWDDEHGGLCYTVEASGEPVVADKYGWVHAEAIGACALLAARDPTYGEWYDRLWAYATENLINPRYGNWYERVARDGSRDGPNRGVEVEPGYHPLSNCWVAMEAVAAGAFSS